MSEFYDEDDIRHDDLLREIQRQDVIAASRAGQSLAGVLNVVIVVVGMFLIVGGVATAINSRAGRSISIAITIAGVIQLLFWLLICKVAEAVSAYIRYRAEFDPIQPES